MKLKVLVGAGLVGSLSLAWAATAGAHPGYPAIIDTTLMLAGKDQLETLLTPTGCQLCHHSSAGMDELREFGTLMVANYGLSASLVENDQSLRVALSQLETENPEAVKDLKAGIDPNSDPVVFESALPTPEYGCDASASRTGDGLWSALAGAMGMAVGLRRRRRFR